MEKYLDGDLAGTDLERFEAHLETCASCREEMEELRELESLLDHASDSKVQPPAYLAGRIMSNLPDRPVSRFLTWKFLHPVAAALSLVLALGVGYMIRDTAQRARMEPVLPQQVRIIFFSPEASSVALIGDFNGWGEREVTVARSSDRGIWEFTLALRPGVYHYNLLVDGERWLANPRSSTLVPDGFGGFDSVLVVSEKCREDCS
jgi:hypothetical protein